MSCAGSLMMFLVMWVMQYVCKVPVFGPVENTPAAPKRERNGKARSLGDGKPAKENAKLAKKEDAPAPPPPADCAS